MTKAELEAENAKLRGKLNAIDYLMSVEYARQVLGEKQARKPLGRFTWALLPGDVKRLLVHVMRRSTRIRKVLAQ